ncbi:hypothetical protein [Aestuariivita boseongensis]|uniref:hypothetical protein n=1 Tax=Aestuariivita boseongensis TaxID=1470562 RepID=UPI000680FFE1|nr:hypothetical protein [Aestuariivita boseongensis]
MSASLVITPDRATYIRNHAWMAAIGMGGAMAVLWIMDNPHVWTGAVAGLAAIALRGWYMASEELAARWEISDGILTGPFERRITLSDIAQVNSLFGYVQIVTHGGDKHLIKYQSDPKATGARIKEAL